VLTLIVHYTASQLMVAQAWRLVSRQVAGFWPNVELRNLLFIALA
jgi:hypothetical protein